MWMSNNSYRFPILNSAMRDAPCKAYAYGVLLFIFSYISCLVFYRLVLSPLARFPGPRLAAATRLYETYFQILKGGTFSWHIETLHQHYGPVVRITPWEIHIKDPDYYNTVYAGPTRHRTKDPWFSFISFPGSIFSTSGFEFHKARRKVLGQFFKRSAVLELEPVISAKIGSLCKHFSAAVTNNRPLELHAAFHCFTSDLLSQHAFGRGMGSHYLEESQLSDTWKLGVTAMFDLTRLTRHFPVSSYLAHAFPVPTSWVVPPFRFVYELEQDVRRRVSAVVTHQRQREAGGEYKNDSLEKAIYPTILADPEVPESEKDLLRLQDDAIFLMVAGTDLPAQALAITMFHILNNTKVYQKLKEELFSGIPDINTTPTLDELERLPYLSAVVRECLRLSAIVTTRLPRSAPDEILQYQQWQIPAGTIVSMSTYFILRDPEIFPEPYAFEPERWLLPRERLRGLEKYLVPGSKGTMGCLGQNMAWAWIHLVLGSLFRRFEFALHETTERNVEITRDNFNGQTDRGLNVIQVKVLEEYCR
ncbi:uncharacterized protein N7446_000284 [Penicillium canescens]|uniref:Cytochrome P450 n=1 Tax=Penicillium canescens TaxID=5083 RepID=A0AAD6I4H6_PENCN|nr:uncharacterized protein N7446_000284 [Penicillium canescens]KAJ6030653.1 hypothetical protein N7460_010919 [Penicillium canescens]KAJ6059631.1 hypothetical protein N7444_003270 [Penicillium canescens]KAJ6077348.1 hypothetical protein N7446_000284 [Penicillium canescens]